MKAALRIGPAFLLGNVMWAALIAAAWRSGLLAPFLGAKPLELHLLSLIGVLFLAGQGATLIGELDAADRIAQWLPPAGLGCFLLALLQLGINADLSSAAGKAVFARSVIESMSLTCAAVIGMVVLESIIWIIEGRGDA